MKSLIAALALSVGLAAPALAGTAYFNGGLATGSPTFVNPGGASGAGFSHYYNVMQFNVTLTGSYVIESASPNTGGGNPSIALDTFLRVYSGSFNPAAPGAGIGSNDDFTGTLTVLPGPYAGIVSPTATGFTGAQPSSRLTVALTAGTDYFLINTSFRQVGYNNTNDGDDDGLYFTGISGQGDINLVPAPATAALLGLGGLVATRRRR
jgi:hypothetical protein